MPAPLLLDLTHTSHSRARTGVQRVTRSLHRALGAQALAITHDPHARTWRALEPWERASLAVDTPARKRGAAWPLSAKLRGAARRWFAAPLPLSRELAELQASGLVVPEVFSPTTAAALPTLFAGVLGPRVAIFHDAIALKFPELTPPGTVARFPPYLRELLAFDGIAAVSEDSRDSLRDYWRWLGIANPPPVQAIPLGVDFAASRASQDRSLAPSATPAVLCVGSIEGRKNHLALLEACERLWADGARFELRLIGLAQPQTGRAALEKLRALQTAGRPLRYEGPVSEEELARAYAGCFFTVYPSMLEGFGLPVIESLAHGKPCVCSARGALGESARDGGCLTLDRVDAPSLAAGIARLLQSPAEVDSLGGAARRRKFRSWADFAAGLTDWMATVPRRA